MTSKAAIRAEAVRLQQQFEAAGALPVEADILQPADILLDLYGEDIRGRAYVTSDPLRGELMMRPDFTVPIVQMHMKDGAEPARYTYSGEVFRRQEVDSTRPSETLQVGYEVFDRDDPIAADAEVFALFQGMLSGLDLRAVTGDIGIVMAAIKSLNTTDRRKAALIRHVWREGRFMALLKRFGGRVPVPPTRAALLANPDPIDETVPLVGLRSVEEIGARISALHEDAAQPFLAPEEAGMLDEILKLKASLPEACDQLNRIAQNVPGLQSAVDLLNTRTEALGAHGVDVSALEFEGSYGRITMEYYDGFVFGFESKSDKKLPPVASGGRYDALTRVLGQGAAIPAVGGVIRPERVIAEQEA
ncbi:MAG: ATP phosphoribosyltransferase regulatory subunit [Marinosulfonomonas sp.]